MEKRMLVGREVLIDFWYYGVVVQLLFNFWIRIMKLKLRMREVFVI